MTKNIRFLALFIAGLALFAVVLAIGSNQAEAQQTGTWRGEYYANPTLSEHPVMIRNDADIDFNWWDGSPASAIPNDYFSVVWTNTSYYSPGSYRFAVTVDDGARVYLDDELIIDSWYPSTTHTVSKDVYVPAGNHEVKVEYYEGTGQAAVALDITPLGSGGSGSIGGGNGGDPGGAYPNWKAEYFTNQSVSGTPALVRDDAYINNDWGTGSPAFGIPADHFSVRWTHTGNYPAGQYKFKLSSDDGARLFINGTEVLSNWSKPTLQPVEVNYWFDGGPATIRVDYYDVTGPAKVRLDVIQVPGGGGVKPPYSPPTATATRPPYNPPTPTVRPPYATPTPVGYPGGGGGGGSYNPTVPGCFGVSYPTGYNAVVTSPSNLNVRRTPSTLSEIIGQFASCTTIPLTGVTDSSGKWVQTELHGQTGWVTVDYLVLGTPVSSMLVSQ
ncbi:MAG: PA14 domain-containing protein [Chloroflexota bacterium]